MQLRIILKSGVDFHVVVEEYTVRHNRLTGGLESLNWITPANAPCKLSYIDLDHIAAILRINEEIAKEVL